MITCEPRLSRESPAYGQVEATGDLQKNARPVDNLTIREFKPLYTVDTVQGESLEPWRTDCLGLGNTHHLASEY